MSISVDGWVGAVEMSVREYALERKERRGGVSGGDVSHLEPREFLV